MRSYFRAFKYYATMAGRTSRREYFWFCFFNGVVWLLLSFVDNCFAGLQNETLSTIGASGTLSLIYWLASLCPAVCIQVRRFHDRGKSGYWFWGLFVPILGAWLGLLLLFEKGEPGINEYGDDPQPERKAKQIKPRNPGDPACPACGNSLSPEALICSSCGYIPSPATNVSANPNEDLIDEGSRLPTHTRSNQVTTNIQSAYAREENVRESLQESTPFKKIRFCRRCGFELIENSEFCSRCGTKIEKQNTR